MLRLISHTAAVERGAATLFSIRSEQSFDEVSIELPGGKIRISQNPAVQRDGRLDAFDDEHLKRAFHAADSLRAVASLDNQLCNHRIVIWRYDGVRISGGIHAHTRASWCLERGNPSRGRYKRHRVLGVNPALDSVTRGDNRPRGIFHFLARGNPDLGLDHAHP